MASVDLGFGAVQALSDSGKRLTFPAVTAPAPRTLGFGDAANERYRRSIGGRDVVVGASAMAHGGGRSLADRADHRTNLGDLLLAALHLLDLGTASRWTCRRVYHRVLRSPRGAPRPQGAPRRPCRRRQRLAGPSRRRRRLSPGVGAYFAALSQHPDLATNAIVEVGCWTTDGVAVAP